VQHMIDSFMQTLPPGYRIVRDGRGHMFRLSLYDYYESFNVPMSGSHFIDCLHMAVDRIRKHIIYDYEQGNLTQHRVACEQPLYPPEINQDWFEDIFKESSIAPVKRPKPPKTIKKTIEDILNEKNDDGIKYDF
jgi:hypothetical protein